MIISNAPGKQRAPTAGVGAAALAPTDVPGVADHQLEVVIVADLAAWGVDRHTE